MTDCDRLLDERLMPDSGVCAYAVTGVAPVDGAEMRRYRAWLGRGDGAGMDYLSRYDDVRSDPALLLDGARSMVICAYSYRHDERPNADGLQIAHYAQGLDYHTVIHRSLAAVGEALSAVDGSAWRVCVDTAPLRERYWARRAGLGFGGRNCTLIIPGIGSMFFIGTLLTTASLTPHAGCIITPAGDIVPTDATEIEEAARRCDSCGACVRACPTGALHGDGTLDARRCINYLTIEHRGDFAPGTPPTGRHLYGCDECQWVCPHNRAACPADVRHTQPDPFAQRDELVSLTARDIVEMTSGGYRRLTRGSAMARASLASLRRNLEAVVSHRPAQER